MWLMTKDGFYSAVEHRDDSTLVMVRARSAADLRTLCEKVGLDPAKEIIESPDADYPARVVFPRAVWTQYLTVASSELDYENFKSAVGKGNPARAYTYHDVWDVLHQIEDESGGIRRASIW